MPKAFFSLLTTVETMVAEMTIDEGLTVEVTAFAKLLSALP